jgi:hypothetical protein
MKHHIAYSGKFTDETGHDIVDGYITISVLHDSCYRFVGWKGSHQIWKQSWMMEKIRNGEVIGIYEIEKAWSKDIDENIILEWVLKEFPYADKIMIRDNFVEKPIDKVK